MDYSIETLVIDAEGNLHPEISPSDVELSETSEYLLKDQVIVKVENVTDKIFVVFENEDENIRREYHYQDLNNGSFTYEVPDNEKIRNFNLTIYSDVSSCPQQELRKITKATPMYNIMASSAYCENNNEYYCQQYVTSEVNIDEQKLMDSYMNISSTNNNTADKKENKIGIIIGTAVIIILVIAIIIVGLKSIKNSKFKKNLGGM